MTSPGLYGGQPVEWTRPTSAESQFARAALQLILSVEKAEDVRKIGIYLGPVIVASIVGNAVYGGPIGFSSRITAFANGDQS